MPYSLPLDTMTTDEKLEAMEALWGDLGLEDAAIPAWHGEELRRRSERIARGEAVAVEMETAIEELLSRYDR